MATYTQQKCSVIKSVNFACEGVRLWDTNKWEGGRCSDESVCAHNWKCESDRFIGGKQVALYVTGK